MDLFSPSPNNLESGRHTCSKSSDKNLFVFFTVTKILIVALYHRTTSCLKVAWRRVINFTLVVVVLKWFASFPFPLLGSNRKGDPIIVASRPNSFLTLATVSASASGIIDSPRHCRVTPFDGGSFRASRKTSSKWSGVKFMPKSFVECQTRWANVSTRRRSPSLVGPNQFQ